MAGLRIGRVAKRAGVGVETVRFYERKGLIDQPPRKKSGYRQYPENTVRRIRFVRRAGELGFSLRETQVLLEFRADSAASGGDVRDRADAKMREIGDRIADLERMKRALAGLTARCTGVGPVGECPILEALEADVES